MRNRITTKSIKILDSSQVRQLSKVAVCVASMFYGSVALANPSGAEVVNGSASFDQQGSQLNITNSHGTIINWNEFSIAENEAVKFLQDNANSAVLNRVVGQLPSDILGELSSNGKVFLINPNGLLIGNGARIDTSGFVGSTLDISNEDFIAGNMTFKGNRGRIQNQGYIAAGKNGEVILIAPQVENSGIIEAEDGNILLAAGREVTLHSLDNPGIAFRVSAAGDEVLNLGQLLAENGSVKIFADQIMQQGTVSANRLRQNADGTIVLEADNGMDVSGVISAKGTENVKGGTIQVLGWTINVRNASIDASGESGGEVLVGGDYQGNGTVKNAQNTNIDSSTVINADAGRNGDGGRVIVWSDDTTNTYARITARGGSQSGDGGFVETSGKKTLDFGQPADVSASNGAAGTWLLDPEDIVIDEGKAASISTSLNGGSNVEVKTSDEGDGEGNITVEAAITKTEGDSAVTLTLDAHNRVDVNAPISSTAGPLNVNIKTGRAVANASSSVEAPRDEPRDEPTDSSPDELVSTDEDQQIVEADNAESPEQVAGVSGEESVDEVVESGEQTTNDLITVQDETEIDTPLDLNADNINDGIDNQAVIVVESSDIQFDPEDGLTIPEEEVQTGVLVIEESSEPASLDTEVQTFIDEDVQQVVITEDIDTAGGSFSIQAGEEGDAIISSEITTSRHAESEGQGAGDITIEADRIALTDDAVVDASGEDAGDILIGGDRQGRNDEVQNADFVYVSEDAQIKSDGGENGDGGKVIVFAKDTAIVQGSITAKGGTESGDGGFIETSGLRGLRVTKAPDASASNGKAGEWLIDPYNIIIGISAGFNVTPSTPFQALGTGAYLDLFTLRTALGTSNVTVETTTAGGELGNITLADALDMNGTAGNNSLTLRAHNNILLNASIYDSDTGTSDERLTNLTLEADLDNDGAGDVEFNSSSSPSGYKVDVMGNINIDADTENVKFDATSSMYGGTVNADGNINIGSSSSSRIGGGVTVTGVSSGGGTNQKVKFTSNNLNIFADDAVIVSAGTNSGNEAKFITTNSQIVYADQVNITGGNTLDTHAGFEVTSGSGSQMFDTTGGSGATGPETGNIVLNAGSGAMAGDAEIATTTAGGSQTFNIHQRLKLNSTNVAAAKIKSQGTQTINTGVGAGGPTSIELTGTAANNALIESVGAQNINTNSGVLNLSNGTVKVTGVAGSVANIGDLAFDAGTIDLNNGTLNIAGNSVGPTFTGSGTMTIMSTTVNNNSTAMPTVMSGGTLDLNDSIFNNNAGATFNQTGGLIDMAGSTFNNNGTFNQSGGNIQVFTPGASTFNNNSVYNWSSGNINVDGGSNFNNNTAGTFNDSGSGTFSAPSGTSFDNMGTYNKTAGSTAFSAILDNIGGTVDVDAGATLNMNSAPAGVGDVYKQSAGTTTVDGTIITSGARSIGFSGGRLEGTGTIGGTTLAATNTTIAPGNSIGTLTVNGDLSISGAGNTLEIEADAPTNHDVLNVTGSVIMSATNTFNLQLIGGYTGPTTLGATDTLSNVVTAGVTSTIVAPTTAGNADSGITVSYSPTFADLSVDLTRNSFPETEEETEEIVEEMTEETPVAEEEMVVEETPETLEETTPEVVDLIVTITEEEREALVEAGVLSDEGKSEDDEDDEETGKKDKPTQMCFAST